jgi:micrococcal nuclease
MYEYKVKEIAKVVDGDTVDVIVDLGFSLFKKERCRVAGIDSPESRTRDKKEKAYGLEAKAYLKGLLSSAENLTVRTEKDGKYGRMLGWLYCDNIEGSINNLMIESGHAWDYQGGTKLTGDERFEVLDRRRADYEVARLLLGESSDSD